MYIVVNGRITVEDHDAKKRNKKLIFKINALITLCISKINNTFIDNTEDPDIIIPKINLLEYSDDYFMTSGSSWNYYRDEANVDAKENNAANNRMNNNKSVASKSFEYKAKIIKRTPDDNNTLDAEVIVPLKYFSNF